jgi:cell division protein FtsB
VALAFSDIIRYLKHFAKLKTISLGSYGLLFMAIFLSFSLVRNIVSFTKSQQALKKEEVLIAELEREVASLEGQVKLVNTQDFVEKVARDKLGLAKEGETVVVLPEDEVLARLAPQIPDSEDFLPEPNWQKWMNLFL